MYPKNHDNYENQKCEKLEKLILYGKKNRKIISTFIIKFWLCLLIILEILTQDLLHKQCLIPK